MLIALSLSAALILGGATYLKLAPQYGESPGGDRLIRIERSPNHDDGRFQNPVETKMGSDSASMLGATIEFMRKGVERVPNQPIPSVPLDIAGLEAGNPEFRAVWLGHSTMLVVIDGVVILTDPVFSEQASPLPFGAKAFDYIEPYSLEDLPPVDIVLISHDHYDHLDYKTIVALKDQVPQFVVPLGVGAHLERWGVAPEKIVEADWWVSHSHGSLNLTATPARHFSGRGLTDRMETLWASWVIEGSSAKVFYGGDSGYWDGFLEIGERFGPFDLVMLECGAYNKAWPTVHMMPEETAQAASDLGAMALLLIHWAKFNLSLHSWTEPIERLSATDLGDIRLHNPRPGQRIGLSEDIVSDLWWKTIDTVAVTFEPDTVGIAK
jgi:L-ascorbate metabolism protein UlaG (beta-lactamase superfamily)